ncbi:MAG: isomerase [Gammaproteobacteria bacterium]|nr:isomerase [Gammaproteobacteria bacterium]
MNNSRHIHATAEVASDAIGEGTRIWQYTVVLAGATIGRDVNICSHCFIENDVRIGDRSTIKAGVQLWDGVSIDDDVFVGPNVTFSNDRYPRSKKHLDQPSTIEIGPNASIGAAAVLLAGIAIGKGAIVGAGAVVTESVPPFAIVTGSPARVTGYVDSLGAEQKTAAVNVRVPQSVEDGGVELTANGALLQRLKFVTDIRGNLSVGEFPSDIPFVPKRYFLVLDVPSKEVRGAHAHRTCQQFLICVHGSCHVVLDDGKTRSEVTLDSPDMGVYIPPMTWGTQYRYSADAVVLVFASDYYDDTDYIRDHEEFIRLLKS